MDEFRLGSTKYFFLGLRGDLVEVDVEGRGVGVGVTSISMVVFRFLLLGRAPVGLPLACRLEEDIVFRISNSKWRLILATTRFDNETDY